MRIACPDYSFVPDCSACPKVYQTSVWLTEDLKTLKCHSDCSSGFTWSPDHQAVLAVRHVDLANCQRARRSDGTSHIFLQENKRTRRNSTSKLCFTLSYYRKVCTLTTSSDVMKLSSSSMLKRLNWIVKQQLTRLQIMRVAGACLMLGVFLFIQPAFTSEKICFK